MPKSLRKSRRRTRKRKSRRRTRKRKSRRRTRKRKSRRRTRKRNSRSRTRKRKSRSRTRKRKSRNYYRYRGGFRRAPEPLPIFTPINNRQFRDAIEVFNLLGQKIYEEDDIRNMTGETINRALTELINENVVSREKAIEIVRKSVELERSGVSIKSILNIENYVTTNVTDMRGLFRNKLSFNRNIGQWDVSNVIQMGSMFRGATSFNQDISGWDTSKVGDMDRMFMGAISFNQNIGSWNLSGVGRDGYGGTESMFEGATSFNGNIENWESLGKTFGNVRSARRMFKGATSFNRNISNWDVSKLTDMNSMFEGAAMFDQNLSGWDVQNVGEFYIKCFDGSAMEGQLDKYPRFIPRRPDPAPRDLLGEFARRRVQQRPNDRPN